MNQFKYWNQQGLIPGCGEKEKDFVKRAQFCEDFDQKINIYLEEALPFNADEKDSQNILQEAYEISRRRYDITPSWVPLFFSNYHLLPWHGGCTWIFQLNETTPNTALLQLRTTFRKNFSYFAYRRPELIAHELCHIGRMDYQQPQFEEILAYRSSLSVWRKWLGPLVHSSRESLFFICVLMLIVISDFVSIFNENNYYLDFFYWKLKVLPLFLIVFACGRLSWRHYLFNCSLKKLCTVYQDDSKAEHVIYRLNDNEIRQFAFLKVQKIKEYIRENQKKSFRWKFLVHNYPLL